MDIEDSTRVLATLDLEKSSHLGCLKSARSSRETQSGGIPRRVVDQGPYWTLDTGQSTCVRVLLLAERRNSKKVTFYPLLEADVIGVATP